jgi:hypothetical protein
MHSACGINDTAWTKKFRTTSKSENLMQNSDGMQKKIKNAQSMNDSNGLGSL